MRNLILILGEQLNRYSAVFDGYDFEQDQIIMIESSRKASALRWHKHKLIAVWSAMRQFATELIEDGYNVYYISIDQSEGKTFRDLLSLYYYEQNFEKIVILEPTSKSIQKHLTNLGKRVPIETRTNNLFLYSTAEFDKLPDEFSEFYRSARTKFRIMMQDGGPLGSQWMFHHSSKKEDAKYNSIKFQQNDTVKMVADYVQEHYPNHPGNSTDFDAPTNADDASRMLDAMFVTNKPKLNTRISLMLNLGILHPLEIIERINTKAVGSPPKHLEKLARKIIHREFLRLKYLTHNDPVIALSAKRGRSITFDGNMHCIADTVHQVEASGYVSAFHRHKILQNMMLLLEYDFDRSVKWFKTNFIDSVDWLIETNLEHNLTSLVINAANSINLSTSFCKSCQFDPKVTIGPRACPFNFLYWSFLLKYRDQLKNLPHLKVHYKRIATMTKDEVHQIESQSEEIRNRLKSSRKN